jgi:tRNA threonylcarbamoyladenosine biosynthesis protein TsaE
MALQITRVGPEAAADVLRIVQAAFSARPPLDPPAAALAETETSIAQHLAAYGGLLARRDGEPVGTLVMDPVGATLYIRRFSVIPDEQGHGIAHAMVDAVVEIAGDDFEDLTIVARLELPRNIRFWDRMGFREITRTVPNVEMRRPLRTHVVEVDTPAEMQALGARLATLLRAGDLLVLSGELGAGKTTFTQGIGSGLGVRAGITSPTFVIARIHPPLDLAAGPELVHVDAYRLGSMAELDDLDLDTDLDEAVTVVEWGEGIAEGLSDSRLEIRIVRALGAGEAPVSGEAPDPRRVEITPVGPRWHALDWSVLFTEAVA